jgi:hypothetical protein
MSYSCPVLLWGLSILSRPSQGMQHEREQEEKEQGEAEGIFFESMFK